MAVVNSNEEQNVNGVGAVTNQGVLGSNISSNQGPVATSESAGVGGGKAGVAAPNAGVTTVQNANPGAPSSSNLAAGSGGFTNLNNYLNANQTGATNLGNKVAGQINTAVNEGQGGINSAAANFGNQVQAGTQNYNPDLVNQAITTPNDFLNNSPELAQLTAMRTGQYTGPTTWAGSSADQAAIQAQQQAQQTAALGQTGAGRTQLLQQGAATPYTQGQAALDQGLIQNTSGAINPVIDASNSGTGLSGNYATAAATGQNQAVQGQNTSQQTGVQTQTALTAAAQNYQNYLNAQATYAQQMALWQQAANAAALNGTTPPAQPTAPPDYTPGQPYTTAAPPPTMSNPQPVAPGPTTQATNPGMATAQAINTGGGHGTATIHPSNVAIQPKNTSVQAPTTPTTTAPASTTQNAQPLVATLPAATLASMGITQAQWTQLAQLQNEAMKYGGGINAGNYLQTVAPQISAANVTTSDQQNQLNALNQLAGNTTNATNLGTAGTEGSQNFNIAGATAALQAQIDAGQANAAQQAQANQAANAAANQTAATNRESATIGVAGGAIAGAEIGSSFGPVGTVVGGVVGAIVGLVSK